MSEVAFNWLVPLRMKRRDAIAFLAMGIAKRRRLDLGKANFEELCAEAEADLERRLIR